MSHMSQLVQVNSAVKFFTMATTTEFVTKFFFIIVMNLPNEFFELLIPVILVSVGLALVAYLTKGSRNFSSSRKKS